MENHGREQVTQTSQTLPPTVLAGKQARDYLRLFQDVISSPKAQLILRNAILTLLEAPGEEFSRDKIGRLLRDDTYRAEIVGKLKLETPEYWSKEWEASWKTDREPLLSIRQESIARRASLVEFWTNEWKTISEDVKSHLTKAI